MVVRAVAIAFLCFAVVACRPRDPLEWRVEGRNAQRLQHWLDETLAEMPEPLARDFGIAVTAIRDTTRGWSTADPETSLNPLCLRLKDRTVRDITIEGLSLTNEHRQSRIQNHLLQIQRLIEASESAPGDATRARYGKRVLNLHRSVEREKEIIAETERRIVDLRNPAPAVAKNRSF